MKEKRIYKLESVEVRQSSGDDIPRIVGYAAVFNRRSVDLGGFTEVISPGAFSDTLSVDPDVRATIDHEGGLNTIGRTTNNTLQLFEDEHGLRVEIVPPNTTAGRDVRTLVERGDVNQMSFMFRVPQGGDQWVEEGSGNYLRTVNRIDLHDGDVAIVTYPAYPQTSVEARDMVKALAEAGDGDTNKAEAKAKLQVRQAQRKRELQLLKRKR